MTLAQITACLMNMNVKLKKGEHYEQRTETVEGYS